MSEGSFFFPNLVVRYGLVQCESYSVVSVVRSALLLLLADTFFFTWDQMVFVQVQVSGYASWFTIDRLSFRLVRGCRDSDGCWSGEVK